MVNNDAKGESAPAIDTTELTVVVVTYFSTRSASREVAHMISLSRCAPSVHWHFVDNSGGTDAAALRSLDPPGNVVVSTHENLGFAGGANLGVAQAQTPWVFLLNPDIDLTLPQLESVLRYARQHRADHNVAISQVTRGHVHCGIEVHGIHWFSDRPLGSSRTLIGPSGGAALVSRRLFLDSGGLHDDLFAWGEDADLAMRQSRLGVHTSELDLRLVHAGGHSVISPAGRRLKARLLARNRVLVARRNLSRGMTCVVVLAQVAVHLALTPRNLKRGTVGAVWAGVADGIRGKGGIA